MLNKRKSLKKRNGREEAATNGYIVRSCGTGRRVTVARKRLGASRPAVNNVYVGGPFLASGSVRIGATRRAEFREPQFYT